MRYWEDLVVGETHRYESHELTQDEIVDFGNRFAAPAVVGADETAAPGLLICCIGMRLLVDHALAGTASLGSPGIDRIDWPATAHSGDVLSLSTELLSSRILESRPEMGLVKQFLAVENQRGQVAARMWTNALFARRGESS